MPRRRKRADGENPTPGTTLGPYRIERPIGRGGMGAVYLAAHVHLNRRVALKVLPTEFSADPVFRERFRREALAQAALDHPNIVPLYEAGEDRGRPFLAMRYVDGPTLKDLIAENALDPATSLRFVAQVADAVESAHRAGIIHRDIKPQNILIERDKAYLADFGLTKIDGGRDLTRTGHRLGTLDYMSPEQFRNEAATPRSDVYSLAAVLYECLVGTVPYRRESDVAVMYAHLEDPLPPLSQAGLGMPPEVDVLFASAMSKVPEDRPVSPRAFVQAVGDVLAVPLPTPVAAPPHPPVAVEPAGGAESTRRLWVRWTLAVVVVCTAGVGAGVATSGIRDHHGTRGHAVQEVSRRVHVGPAAVIVPDQWRRRGTRTATTAVFALGSRNTLRMEVVHEALPELARMSAHSPSVVTAGGYRAEAYVLPPLRRTDRGRAYLFPLRTADVLLICRTTTVKSNECGRIVGTIRFGARPQAQLPRATYARAIDRIFHTLAQKRRKLRKQLQAAPSGAKQAASALALGSLFSTTATSVQRLKVRDVPRKSGEDLATTLNRVARAYRSLARAAQVQDSGVYAAALRAITEAERRVSASTALLRASLSRA